jgi:hypothetical protein
MHDLFVIETEQTLSRERCSAFRSLHTAAKKLPVKSPLTGSAPIISADGFPGAISVKRSNSINSDCKGENVSETSTGIRHTNVIVILGDTGETYYPPVSLVSWPTLAGGGIDGEGDGGTARV